MKLSFFKKRDPTPDEQCLRSFVKELRELLDKYGASEENRYGDYWVSPEFVLNGHKLQSHNGKLRLYKSMQCSSIIEE